MSRTFFNVRVPPNYLWKNMDLKMGSCACIAEGERGREPAELGVSSHEKCRDSAKGLQCHLACTGAGTGDPLLAFLWCSIIKVICHIENLTGLRVFTVLNLPDSIFSLRRAPGPHPRLPTGINWRAFKKYRYLGSLRPAPLLETDLKSLHALLLHLTPALEGSWH